METGLDVLPRFSLGLRLGGQYGADRSRLPFPASPCCTRMKAAYVPGRREPDPATTATRSLVEQQLAEKNCRRRADPGYSMAPRTSANA